MTQRIVNAKPMHGYACNLLKQSNPLDIIIIIHTVIIPNFEPLNGQRAVRVKADHLFWVYQKM